MTTGWQRRLSGYNGAEEHFADMFLGWVYNKWEIDPTTGQLTQMGASRSSFMNLHMREWIGKKVQNFITLGLPYWP